MGGCVNVRVRVLYDGLFRVIGCELVPASSWLCRFFSTAKINLLFRIYY